MHASRELDIVLFGATGVTGTYVVEELHRSSEGLRWGVAGRDADKLRRTLRAAATNLDMKEDALDSVPIIVANVEDNASLLAMAQRTRLVLNAVGPGMKVNCGTWESIIHMVAHASELVNLRQQNSERVFTKPLPKRHSRLARRVEEMAHAFARALFAARFGRSVIQHKGRFDGCCRHFPLR
ncbi:hypothetical protein HPB52_010438 [Rhipicephalus sanguineus]|uniref:Saccharopine dehydrogenase NADP binding domain-containing protein n=1 Tax=Rhipicephalus sanguineus TaxID=34632 RepID=A0A9D4T7G0_RHISA|nr:hypothetical protein HPB52_010438 [Rhipicephalus sanguineus]